MEHQPYLYLWGKTFYSVLPHEQTNISNTWHYPSIRGYSYLFCVLFGTHSLSQRHQNLLSSSLQSPHHFRLWWSFTGLATVLLKEILCIILCYQGSLRIQRQPVTRAGSACHLPHPPQLARPTGFVHGVAAFTLAFLSFFSVASLPIQGHVVLIPSLTSQPIVWLSIQVWYVRSTCLLHLRCLKRMFFSTGSHS